MQALCDGMVVFKEQAELRSKRVFGEGFRLDKINELLAKIGTIKPGDTVRVIKGEEVEEFFLLTGL